MERAIKMLLYGTVAAFLFVIVMATLFWPYLNIQIGLKQQPALVDFIITDERDQLDGTAVDLASLQVEAQSRGLVYQEQIEQLQAAIQEREEAYQAQLAEANAQLATYQEAMTQIQQEVETLNAEIDRLAQLTAERQTTYQTQLNEAVEEMNLYRTELINQLTTARQALAEANAGLGQ